MDFDKKSLEKLRSLSDEELMKVLKDIAAENGIATDTLKIGRAEIFKIRMLLSMASEEEIKALIAKFGGKKQ